MHPAAPRVRSHRYRVTKVVTVDYGANALGAPPQATAHLACLPDGSYRASRPETFAIAINTGEVEPGDILHFTLVKE